LPLCISNRMSIPNRFCFSRLTSFSSLVLYVPPHLIHVLLLLANANVLPRVIAYRSSRSFSRISWSQACCMHTCLSLFFVRTFMPLGTPCSHKSPNPMLTQSQLIPPVAPSLHKPLPLYLSTFRVRLCLSIPHKPHTVALLLPCLIYCRYIFCSPI